MRLVVHEYAQGGRVAFETSDDGAKLLTEWGGTRRVGERLCAFIEVACDHNDQAIDRVLESLNFLTEEIRRRQQQPVGTAAQGGP